MRPSKINVFFTTLNVLLAIAGYQFFTTLLFPLMPGIEASRIVTVPYRAFALGVTLITILLNIRSRIKLDRVVKLLLVFWAFLLLRFFYDIGIRYDIYVRSDIINRVLMSMIPLTLIPMYSVMKSYKNINFDKLLKWTYILFSITVFIAFFTNEAFQETTSDRLGANMALNTISTGHLGLSTLVLSFIMFRRTKKGWRKSLIGLIGAFSLLIMLRAGSRGPLLAAIGILAVWLYSGTKYKIVNLVILSIVTAVGFLLSDYIMLFISNISPALYGRFMYKVEVGQFDDRAPLFKYAIDSFLDSPLLGKNFGIYSSYGYLSYTHNIVLEAFMQVGIFGGIILIYILAKSILKASSLIIMKSPYMWLGIILFQEIMKNMVSGSFYYNSLLSILIVLLFMPLDQNNYSLRRHTTS